MGEKRNPDNPSRRGIGMYGRQERRLADRAAGHTGKSGGEGVILTTRQYADRESLTNIGLDVHRRDSPSEAFGQDIVSVHKTDVRPERRLGGAGRRSGDLARAMKTGEPVVFQAGKGALAKKVLGKAGKVGKVAAAALTLYDMVSRAKQ